MNKRRVMVGAGLVALAGIAALTAQGFFTRSRNDGRVTLRSRVLDYEDRLKILKPRPRTESVEADITAMMEEYFRIGMRYDECIKILEDNDLAVDEKYTNEPDYRIRDRRVYFSPSIVSVVNTSFFAIIVTCQYRLGLGFHNLILDEISASRVCSGL